MAESEEEGVEDEELEGGDSEFAPAEDVVIYFKTFRVKMMMIQILVMKMQKREMMMMMMEMMRMKSYQMFSI